MADDQTVALAVDGFLNSKLYRKTFKSTMKAWSILVPSVLNQYCDEKKLTLTPEQKLDVIRLAGPRRNEPFDDGGPNSGSSESAPGGNTRNNL